MDVNQERDNDFDKALRPLSFDDFIGQKPIISNLKIFVEASNQRDDALDLNFSWSRLSMIYQ